jgi:hypothetical protein
MKSDEVWQFLRKNVEPVKDPIRGNRYRAAAHLIDGTYLPCVVFESTQARVELALRRFSEFAKNDAKYRKVVESFVAGGSHVADYYLSDVEVSPFAWPIELLTNIHGETIMSWTAFVAEMKDGTMYSYGTPFNFEFFDLPHGYSHTDISTIHSGMQYSQTKGLEKFSLNVMEEISVLREKPFITCYLKALSTDRLEGR